MKQQIFDHKTKLIIPKNPHICLYHALPSQFLDTVVKDVGLNPHATIREMQQVREEIMEKYNLDEGDEDEIEGKMDEVEYLPKEVLVRQQFDEMLDRNQDAIYFHKKWTNLANAGDMMSVKVPAEHIPGKCIEYDYEESNKLWDMLLAQYSMWADYDFGTDDTMEQIDMMYTQANKIKATARPLTNKKFYKSSEVLCPCRIPSEIIFELDEKGYGSCRLPNKD